MVLFFRKPGGGSGIGARIGSDQLGGDPARAVETARGLGAGVIDRLAVRAYAPLPVARAATVALIARRCLDNGPEHRTQYPDANHRSVHIVSLSCRLQPRDANRGGGMRIIKR